MTDYTKGDWTRQGNKITAFGSGTIAICPPPTNDEGVFEFIANAHLIAAAPELYEALKYIVRALDEANVIKTTSIFMEMPNKAIAKARGK